MGVDRSRRQGSQNGRSVPPNRPCKKGRLLVHARASRQPRATGSPQERQSHRAVRQDENPRPGQ
eukprot:12747203-Alexandrium_andersonii.AAC.1